MGRCAWGFVVLSVLVMSNPALAGETGFYLGGALGYSRQDVDKNPPVFGPISGPTLGSSFPFSDVPAPFPASVTVVTVTATPPTVTRFVDDNDLGWKVYGGYAFNRYFNLEAGYVNLGKSEINDSVQFPSFVVSAFIPAPAFGPVPPGASISTTTATLNARAKAEVRGFTFAAMAKYPVLEKFRVFGKIGAFFWQTDTTVSTSIESQSPLLSSSQPGLFSFDDSGTDLMFGAGAEYDITERWGLRAEWERYSNIGNNDGDIDYFSGGVIFRFN